MNKKTKKNKKIKDKFNLENPKIFLKLLLVYLNNKYQNGKIVLKYNHL